VCCEYSSPTLTNNTISGNSASYGGGVCCANDSSPTLTNNTISGNSASIYGGGVCCANDSSPTLTNDTITGNSASGSAGNGGGVYCTNSSSPILINNVISHNSATGIGGGVWCDGSSSPTLTNDTISENSATDGGGVFCLGFSSPIIKNTIIALSTKGGGLCCAGAQSVPVVTYSDVYGNTGGNYLGCPDPTGKNGNISVAPAFANAAAGDFHLKSQYGRWNPSTKTWVLDTVTSPCIDAGDPTSAFNLEPAPNGGRINMGKGGDTINASKSPTTTTSAATLTVSAAAVSTSGGSAQIVVTLASAASVEATVLNVAGREIAVLPAQDLAAGVSTMLWNGRSALGTKVPAGRYMVRVTARTQNGGQAQALVALELAR
jgi:parallel beta-helix repeat protein